MIELTEETRVEFSKEAAIIYRSLKRCVQYNNIEQSASFFKQFVRQTLAISSFKEEEYLNFAAWVIEELKHKTSDKNVVVLLANLSRINSDVSSIYKDEGINTIITQAIVEAPDYYSTPFNNIMVFDYLYSYYYWRTQEINKQADIEQVLNFLAAILVEQPVKGEEIIASIISSFMSIYYKSDKITLNAILDKFGYIKPVEKKALRLLG